MKKERNKVELGSMEGCSSVGDGNGKKRAEKDLEEAVEINQVTENNPPPDNEPPSIYFPPGYHFHPNDYELILYYLLPKLQNKRLPYNHIKDVVLADYDPEVLTAKYKFIEKSEWYFFTPRERKYKKGSRPNRAAGSGYWKATGVDIPIKSNGETVGFKKSLVFYTGKPPNGGKSNWILSEYRIKGGVFEGTSRERDMSSMRLDDWVLCKIYKKTNGKNVSEESPISPSSRDYENESPSACPRDHENESLIASQSDCENKSPIAYQRDHENDYLIACQIDYGDVKMKKVMEESSHGNKMTTLDISSYWYGDEKMNMVMVESSYGSKMISPEITSSKKVSNESSFSPFSRDYENESPITCPGDHENESLISCQRDHENKSLISCQRDHENKSPTAYQRDQFHNVSLIACKRDYGDEKMKMVMEESSHGNKTISTPEFNSPIAYQRDQFHIESLIVCKRDYEDEKKKMVMEESLHGNKTISTPEFSSGTFHWSGDEKMKMEMEDSSYGNQLISPEIMSEIFDWNGISQMLTDGSDCGFDLLNELISNSYYSNAYDPYMLDYLQPQPQPQRQPQLQPQPQQQPQMQPQQPQQLLSAVPTIHSSNTLGQFDLGSKDEVEDMIQIEILKQQLDHLRRRGPML